MAKATFPNFKKKEDLSKLIRSKKINDFIPAMLAKETAEPFDNKDWIFEIKWDGYRAIAEVSNGNVKLYSRNGLSFENAYPTVFNALKLVKQKVVLDGEIVVLNESGQPNFQLLQHYENNKDKQIIYYVFDLLEVNGKNVCDLPLVDRKKLLKSLKFKSPIIKYSDHILKDGISFFEVSKEQELEGTMAKKADSIYMPGRRTTDWLKIKHHKTQEAIICGFTPPSGSRKYFGSLVLGIFDDKKELIYIGNSGSGFNFNSLKETYDAMKPVITNQSPFKTKVNAGTVVTWLKPLLVAEIKYSEKTNDGKLRHPIFMHLRDDKSIKEVTVANNKVMKINPSAKGNKKDDQVIYTFGKNKVAVSHPDKIYFPGDNITKGDVIEYYISMSKYILPYLKGRPESLLRNPGGIGDKAFFHKDAGEDAPSFVKRQLVYSESTKKNIDYIVCDNQPTLTYMNNMGCIEINPWHSTLKSLDKPDYLIIDIDPSNKNNFEQVIEAANVVKEILDKAEVVSFCKTSGSSGLHVYVPTGKKYTYEQVKDFAYLVCMLAQEAIPDFTTLERNLQKRGNKHIYMDYLQNRRGQTIASVYSLRPKPGATVSTPLLWKEVKSGLHPSQFNIKNIKKRVDKIGDIFSGILGKGMDINKSLKKLGN